MYGLMYDAGADVHVLCAMQGPLGVVPASPERSGTWYPPSALGSSMVRIYMSQLPAKNTVYTPYMYLSGQPYTCVGVWVHNNGILQLRNTQGLQNLFVGQSPRLPLWAATYVFDLPCSHMQLQADMEQDALPSRSSPPESSGVWYSHIEPGIKAGDRGNSAGTIRASEPGGGDDRVDRGGAEGKAADLFDSTDRHRFLGGSSGGACGVVAGMGGEAVAAEGCKGQVAGNQGGLGGGGGGGGGGDGGSGGGGGGSDGSGAWSGPALQLQEDYVAATRGGSDEEREGDVGGAYLQCGGVPSGNCARGGGGQGFGGRQGGCASGITGGGERSGGGMGVGWQGQQGCEQHQGCQQQRGGGQSSRGSSNKRGDLPRPVLRVLLKNMSGVCVISAGA